jgi:hypothetical protein
MGDSMAFNSNVLEHDYPTSSSSYNHVLTMVLPSIVSAHAASTPVYAAGVTVGQLASYAPVNVTYHGTGPYATVPPSIKDLNATSQLTATVQQLYSSTNVTLQSVTQYKNGTTQTAIRNGDLMTGIGNLTFGLIAGGLSSRDHLWVGTYTPTINQTILMTYLGVTRTVNIYNTTYRIPFGTVGAMISLEYVWDQPSGATLEYRYLKVYPSPVEGGYVEFTDVKIQSTNIFSNPASPDFTITSSNPPSVTTGTSATSTITVIAVKGFIDTVTLADEVPSGLTCGAISPGTLPGHGTASLSCSSAIPGTYNVNITGASGPTTHTTTATLTIVSPSQAPNAPTLGLAPLKFYAIIGAIMLAIAAMGVYLVLRTKKGLGKRTTSAITM